MDRTHGDAVHWGSDHCRFSILQCKDRHLRGHQQHAHQSTGWRKKSNQPEAKVDPNPTWNAADPTPCTLYFRFVRGEVALDAPLLSVILKLALGLAFIIYRDVGPLDYYSKLWHSAAPWPSDGSRYSCN